MIPLITIEGATAVGKSDFAIELAKALSTDIISADSRQVYRHLNIGTAKPDIQQQQMVKHHLIDIINPEESYNAGRFVADLLPIATDLYTNGKIPIVCGGTGLYIRSLLEGLFICPPADSSIRERIQMRMDTESVESLYQELHQIDPIFAAKISIKDKQRIQRGLEVFYSSAKTLSEHWKEQEKQKTFKAFRILVQEERELLYQRINQRVEKMLATGLLKEIEYLFELGYTEQTIGLKTLGYKEFIPYLQHSQSLIECTTLAQQHTRNYAKRQNTWYRKYDFHLTISPHSIKLSNVLEQINSHLSGC